MLVPLAFRSHQPAVGWVRWLGILIANLFDYMAFCLTLTTENCSEHKTHHSTYLRAKNRLNRQLLWPLGHSFFRCNISWNGAMMPHRIKQRISAVKPQLYDNRKASLA
jgi:hypothetical protein